MEYFLLAAHSLRLGASQMGRGPNWCRTPIKAIQALDCRLACSLFTDAQFTFVKAGWSRHYCQVVTGKRDWVSHCSLTNATKIWSFAPNMGFPRAPWSLIIRFCDRPAPGRQKAYFSGRMSASRQPKTYLITLALVFLSWHSSKCLSCRTFSHMAWLLCVTLGFAIWIISPRQSHFIPAVHKQIWFISNTTKSTFVRTRSYFASASFAVRSAHSPNYPTHIPPASAVFFFFVSSKLNWNFFVYLVGSPPPPSVPSPAAILCIQDCGLQVWCHPNHGLASEIRWMHIFLRNWRQKRRFAVDFLVGVTYKQNVKYLSPIDLSGISSGSSRGP